ncbi:MAG: ammonia-dependent NAD(+) synthetase [Pseudorhizobium sp.]
MSNQQPDIISALGVTSTFDAGVEVERRISFLSSYLRRSSMKALVLGISGGVDSTAAGLLAQRAVERLRDQDYQAQFLAVRLPYGVQVDEADAQKALEVIRPDRVVTVDIKPAADAVLAELRRDASDLYDDARADFHHGNIKARQRMIVQYALAGAAGGLVIGTDQAAEALMGFFTKFGDGAADILPLAGLNKRRVRAVALHLGAPRELVDKVPTADLESDAPLRPDEDAFGVTYEEIDDFLENKPISPISRDRILATHRASAHKRALPVTPE